MTASKIRVLIVDDHDLARAGLRGIVEDETDMQIAGEAKDGAMAVELFRSTKPDVVLMDVRMPKFDGIQATGALLREDPEAKVLIVSSYDTEEDVFRAHGAGARGYLLKESRGPEIVQALRTVARGGRYMPASVAERLRTREEAEALTARERQVLVLLHKGHANRQIAAELSLSAGTVRMYVSQVLHKLNAENRTEAVATGLRRGLIRQE